MNRLLLLTIAICAGGLGFGVLHRSAAQKQRVVAAGEQACLAITNELAEIQNRIASLRAEVVDKKNRVQATTKRRDLSPALLGLLEGNAGNPAAFSELRQQLGIGWDGSPDYVLVNKRVLKELDYPRLYSGASPSGDVCDLLALSSTEQSAIKEILNRAREGQWLKIERVEPSGDVVAQYNVPPPDPAFEQSQSNLFATEITGLLGEERASLFLSEAWREFKSELTPGRAETLTVRRGIVEGKPDLIWEMKQADQVSSAPVRYAHYPSMWFLTMFPGGWQTLADREGFDLPESFRNEASPIKNGPW